MNIIIKSHYPERHVSPSPMGRLTRYLTYNFLNITFKFFSSLWIYLLVMKCSVNVKHLSPKNFLLVYFLQCSLPAHHWIQEKSAQMFILEAAYIMIFPGFRIRIRINLSCWIRIRIQIADPDPDPGGQKWPQNIEKRTEFSSFEVLDVLFWRLKVSPVAWASFMEA